MPKIVDTLKADPLKFLKVFPIKITTAGESCINDNVSYGQKSTSGYPTELAFNTGYASFDDPTKTETCKAHIVKAQVGGLDFYTLTDDCDLMLTSQLSGCCMVLDRSVNPPRVAHYWPDKAKGEDGNTVQTNLQGTANRKLYGLKNYTTPYSYVLGVRNGGWRFFAQERPMGRGISRALEIFL